MGEERGVRGGGWRNTEESGEEGAVEGGGVDIGICLDCVLISVNSDPSGSVTGSEDNRLL